MLIIEKAELETLGIPLPQEAEGKWLDHPNGEYAVLEGLARDREKELYAMIFEAREKQEIRQRQQAVAALKPGDGVTLALWSDRQAYTITRRTKHYIWARRDKATLTNGDTFIFTPGGFCGHTAYPEGQKYTYESDPNGEEIRIHIRPDGTMQHKGMTVWIGRHEFYDRNF